MKLIGARRKGRHLTKNISKSADEASNGQNNTITDKIRRIFGSWWKKALIGLGIAVFLTAAVLALDIWQDTGIIIKPPDVKNEPKTPQETTTGEAPFNPGNGGSTPSSLPGEGTVGNEVTGIRNENMITFLVFGMDDGGGNSDVIMVVNFDIKNYTFNAVSIPRDTLVNVSWSVKKANSILSSMRARHRGEEEAEAKGMEDTVKAFSDILGFEVDYWVTVNMSGFVSLINAINGVDFNIPENMNYDDPDQNLHIHYTKGMKKGLTGQQVLEILRFRSYKSGSADIGRIGTQQDLLKAAVEQILAKRSSINVSSLAEIFIKHVKTDLKLNNVIWLGLEFLKMDAENVSFVMMPGNNIDYVGKSSYVTIYIDEWLEMVNEKLNPYFVDMTKDDVSILTRGADRKLYVTDGNWQGDPSWGASSRGPGTGGGSGSSSGSGSGSSSGGAGSSNGGASTTPGSNPGEVVEVDPNDEPDQYGEGQPADDPGNSNMPPEEDPPESGASDPPAQPAETSADSATAPTGNDLQGGTP